MSQIKALTITIGGDTSSLNIAGAQKTVHYLGVTSTEITDGSSVTTVAIDEETCTVSHGDIVDYDGTKFIYDGDEEEWMTLGSGGGGVPSVVVGTITLPSASWTQGAGEYTQTVTISWYTPGNHTKVDIQPSKAVLNQMASDNTSALFIDCTNGVLTAHALGYAPTVNLTIQCTITETIQNGNEVSY